MMILLLGVQHGWDIFYVFGVPTVGHPKFSYTARDAEVSKVTMQLIRHFVKEGYDIYWFSIYKFSFTLTYI